jgi:hypothetical protein
MAKVLVTRASAADGGVSQARSKTVIEIRNQWLVFFFLGALLVVTACSTQPSAQSNEPLMNIFTPLPTVKTNYLPTPGVTTATRLSTKFPTEISTPLPISQTATAPSLTPTTTESARPPLTPTFPAENHLKGPLMQGNCILFNQRALSANSRCPIQLSAAWF